MSVDQENSGTHYKFHKNYSIFIKFECDLYHTPNLRLSASAQTYRSWRPIPIYLGEKPLAIHAQYVTIQVTVKEIELGKDRSYTTAIHVLAVLSYRGPGLVTSEDLAKALKTNPGLIRRVLSKLVKNGLVESNKGKGGGNRLARTVDKISLKDVYTAVKEGPLFASYDKEPIKACPVSCNIGPVLKGVYDGLEDDLQMNMKSISLANIFSKIS